jgi:hypothetical protein
VERPPRHLPRRPVGYWRSPPEAAPLAPEAESLVWPGAESRALVEPSCFFSWPGAQGFALGEASEFLQAVEGSREALPAAAPDTSDDDFGRGVTPVRSGKLLEPLVEDDD